MNGLMLIVCGLLPSAEPVVTDCDSVEVNAFYAGDGTHSFTQLIYEADGQITAWKMLRTPNIIPIRRGRYSEAIFHDEWVLRRVRTYTVNYTWTQDDREVLEREKWPADKRRGLGTP